MSDDRLKVALLGHGYWGRNLARNVQAHPGFDLSLVVDPIDANREDATNTYPDARGHRNSLEAIAPNDDIDVVVVATPVSTHHELARWALECGKHVLISKPITETSEQAEDLVKLARKSARTLMVDHTFVYTGSVQKLRSLTTEGQLGDLIYCSSVRVNLGTYRRDSDVIWDLAPHDLSILDSIGYGSPCAVTATAGGKMGGQADQVAHLTLFYGDGFISHINVSWLAPVKMRLMLFGGTKHMVVYDDVEPSEKIKVYDKGMTIDHTPGQHGPLVEYRSGDMWAPKLDTTEALFAEMTHLRECVTHGTTPITDGVAGLHGVRILEAASRSVRRGGEVVVLDEQQWKDVAAPPDHPLV